MQKIKIFKMLTKLMAVLTMVFLLVPGLAYAEPGEAIGEPPTEATTEEVPEENTEENAEPEFYIDDSVPIVQYLKLHEEADESSAILIRSMGVTALIVSGTNPGALAQQLTEQHVTYIDYLILTGADGQDAMVNEILSVSGIGNIRSKGNRSAIDTAVSYGAVQDTADYITLGYISLIMYTDAYDTLGVLIYSEDCALFVADGMADMSVLQGHNELEYLYAFSISGNTGLDRDAVYQMDPEACIIVGNRISEEQAATFDGMFITESGRYYYVADSADGVSFKLEYAPVIEGAYPMVLETPAVEEADMTEQPEDGEAILTEGQEDTEAQDGQDDAETEQDNTENAEDTEAAENESVEETGEDTAEFEEEALSDVPEDETDETESDASEEESQEAGEESEQTDTEDASEDTEGAEENEPAEDAEDAASEDVVETEIEEPAETETIEPSGTVDEESQDTEEGAEEEKESEEAEEPATEEAESTEDDGKKSNEEIAVEVLNGLWGYGEDRFNRLRNSGYDPDLIQSLVDQNYGKSAKWFYAVNFNANGHGTAPDSRVMSAGDTIEEPEPLTAEGFIFTGWYTEKECENLFDFSQPQEHTLTLYAGWEAEEVEEPEPETEPEQEAEPVEYTVTFYGNGQDISIASQTVASGETITMPDEPSVTGYSFDGWYEEAGCIHRFDAAQAITADTELYASWTPNAYTLQYDANGGVGEIISKECIYDQEYEIGQNAFTRTGYEFTGWNTEADGSGDSYKEGASVSNLAISNKAVVTLFAQWKSIYEVKTGGGQSVFRKGKAEFMVIGEISKLTGVYIDDAKQESKYYEAWADTSGIHLTLNEECTDRLGIGSHTLKVAFSDGECETVFTVAAGEPETNSATAPSTGDTNNAWIWFLVGGCAMAAAVCVIVILARRLAAAKANADNNNNNAKQ